MSISSIGYTDISSLQGLPGMSGGGQIPDQMKKAMDPVAKLLGMSTDDLASKLQSGTSLSDLASQKGVSNSDLVEAIKSGMQQNAPAGVSLAADQLTQMANAIATQSGPPAGRMGGGASGPTQGVSTGSSDSTTQQLLDLLTQITNYQQASGGRLNSATMQTTGQNVTGWL